MLLFVACDDFRCGLAVTSRFLWLAPYTNEILDVDTSKIDWEGLDWLNLSQDWDKWPVLVNTALNLRVSLKCEEFLGQLRNCFSRKTVT